jgi:hypothetical protein
VKRAVADNAMAPERLKPLVAIGHTKDLDDFSTVEDFLSFLREEQIGISTFQQIYPKLSGVSRRRADNRSHPEAVACNQPVSSMTS